MENQIKLRPKQLEQLNNLRMQRARLDELIKDANQRELDLLTLIFEEANVTGEVNNVKLENDVLSYEVVVPAPKKVKAVKKLEKVV